MEVDRIAEGLWRWTARHPEWTPASLADDGWGPEVGCVYLETEEGVVLVDPLVPDDRDERERFLRALDRDVERAGGRVALVFTLFFHERSAEELAERYAASTVWAPAQAAGRLAVGVTNLFRPGEGLPGGIEAIDVHRRAEVLLWLPHHHTLVAGDVLVGDDDGGVRVCRDDWLPKDVAPAEFRTRLRPLLELPVERVLPSHGEPVLANGRAALALALDAG